MNRLMTLFRLDILGLGDEYRSGSRAAVPNATPAAANAGLWADGVSQ